MTTPAEQAAFDMMRNDVTPAFVEVLKKHVCFERACEKLGQEEQAAAAAKMLKIWQEVGEYYQTRIGEEFPALARYYEIQRAIREALGEDQD